MPSKYESIVLLAEQTAREITRDGESYMSFITTAAHNFKYSFRDQLLIFAQKPEATACAAGPDRGPEGPRSDEVVGPDEQYPGIGGGSGV